MKPENNECTESLERHLSMNTGDLAAGLILGFFKIYSGDPAGGCKDLYQLSSITDDSTLRDAIIVELMNHPEIAEVEGVYFSKSPEDIHLELLRRLRIQRWPISDIEPWYENIARIPKKSRWFIHGLVLRCLEIQHHQETINCAEKLKQVSALPEVVLLADTLIVQELLLKTSRLLENDDYSESQRKELCIEKSSLAFDSALNLFSSDATMETGNLLAEALELGFKSDPKLGFKMLDTMAKIKTDAAFFLIKRVYLYIRHGRLKEADKEIDQLLKSYPEGPQAAEALFLKGRIVTRKGKMDEADKYYLKALAMEDGGPITQTAADSILSSAERLNSGKPTASVKLLLEAAELNEKEAPRLLMAAGQTYIDNEARFGIRNSKIKAAEIFKTLIEDYPNSADSAMARRRLEKLQPLLDSMQKSGLPYKKIILSIIAVAALLVLFFL